VVELVLWMQHREVHLRGLSPAKSALITVTQDCKFHPVRDYLDGVEWDGRPRLANMLHDYLGVKPIPGYTDKVGLKWMVSAVARVMRPGCTAKYVLTLLGPQDLGKSTVFRVLGGEHFTDDVAQLGTKDSSLQIGNAWIIELAELDSTARAEQSTIKAFISREVDRFRPPYGTHVVEQKRECILCATVNPSGKIFKDETGAVRFWGVTCTAVDIVSLRRDRDQLWAEAAHLYRAGEAWWFTDEEEESTALAREQQAEHSEMVQDHPWTDLLSEWLAEREAEVDEEVERYRVAGRELDWGDVEGHVDLGDARCRVRRSDGTLVFQIYEALEALGVERKHMNSPHVWRQVSKILMDLGWRSGSVDRACCPTGKQERVRRWQRVAVIEELEAPGGGEGAGSAGEGGAEREPGEDEDDGYEEDDGRHEQ
jgi:predicted P-loop ATPase